MVLHLGGGPLRSALGRPESSPISRPRSLRPANTQTVGSTRASVVSETRTTQRDRGRTWPPCSWRPSTRAEPCDMIGSDVPGDDARQFPDSPGVAQGTHPASPDKGPPGGLPRAGAKHGLVVPGSSLRKTTWTLGCGRKALAPGGRLRARLGRSRSARCPCPHGDGSRSRALRATRPGEREQRE